jgi:23S rRNA pseudouridine1911/1915/1917 synthase
MPDLPIARVERFEVPSEQEGERLDRFLAHVLEKASRTEVQRLIKSGLVAIDGETVRKPALRLAAGDMIVIQLPDTQPQPLAAEQIPLSILYEDDDLVAIDKPAGMVVHPAHGHATGTLVNAALAYWPQVADLLGEERPGIIHRLDKDTSGVILLAKTRPALLALQAQFKARTVSKQYIALVEGIPDNPDGVIDAPIGRDPHQRKRMAVVRQGRPSSTRYHVVETFGDTSLLEVTPLTGRTHQIRVHMAWIRHPIVGDTVYGRRKPSIPIERHFLHAAKLTVHSPTGGHELTFSAPLPDALAQVLDQLRRRSGHDD